VEKLASEDMYATAADHYGYEVYIARFHNVFGPLGSWNDGREKAPAALCRKIAEAKHRGSNRMVVWGDGKQTRSFCYIEDCLDMIMALVKSDFHEPLNIGTDEMVSINNLAGIIMDAADWSCWLEHDLTKPQGVRGRNADLTKMKEALGIKPRWSLKDGISETYQWIEEQVRG
jgi:nucleoside-diphosphate-sugar epimerase